MDLLALAAAVEAAATAPVKPARVKRARKVKTVVKPETGTGAFMRSALDKLADNAADPIGRGLWVK